MSVSIAAADPIATADTTTLAQRLAADAVVFLKDRMRAETAVHLAVSGGSLATAVLPELVARGNSENLNWAKLHVWFVDERFVARGSADRNATEVVAAMRKARGFVSAQLHIPLADDGQANLAEAAAEYERELLRTIAVPVGATVPMLDLVLLGMGPDGHTASLFPGLLPHEDETLVIPVSNSPKPPPARISFTFRMLDAAHSCWLYATGKEKRAMLAAARSGGSGMSSTQCPAARIRAAREVRIYADTAALG